jgi:PAS domain S-box-containing protein
MGESARFDSEIWAEFFDRSNDILLAIDVTAGRVAEANDTATRELGYDIEDLRDTPIENVAGFEAETTWEEYLAAHTGADHDAVTELYTAEGETIPVEADVTWAQSAGEEYALVVARDVSTRTERAAELRREKERAEQYFETAGTIMVVLDRAGYVERINERGCDLLGYERSELEGEDWFELVVPEEIEADIDAIFEGYASGRIEGINTHTNPIVTRDGSRRHVQWHNTALRDEEGTVDGILASGIDLTDRLAYERELESQRDDLEVLNQVMRHDIRNDLQLVTAYAEILLDRLDGEERDYLETIESSSKSAVHLTKVARDLSKAMLETEGDLEPVPLASTVDSQVEKARSAYGSAVISVDGSIPAVAVRANELLDSAVWNVLQNAVEHNDRAVPEVHVSADRSDGSVTLSIADNGPGIPDERKDGVFQRGESENGGAGLGLYLVDYIVDSYDGSVWIEDNEPRGAVFHVRLPTWESRQDTVEQG